MVAHGARVQREHRLRRTPQRARDLGARRAVRTVRTVRTIGFRFALDAQGVQADAPRPARRAAQSPRRCLQGSREQRLEAKPALERVLSEDPLHLHLLVVRLPERDAQRNGMTPFITLFYGTPLDHARRVRRQHAHDEVVRAADALSPQRAPYIALREPHAHRVAQNPRETTKVHFFLFFGFFFSFFFFLSF